MNKQYRRTIFLLTIVLCAIQAMAQTPKSLTLEDLIPGSKTYIRAKAPSGLKWWGDTLIKPEKDVLVAINPRNGKETTFLSKENLKQLTGLDVNLARNISFPWAGKTLALIKDKNVRLIVDWKKQEILNKITLPEGYENEDFCLQTNHIAYTLGNNLYVGDAQITDVPEGIVCGQSVHRNEFGIYKGTFWSPDGNLLAFYYMDESEVTQYPLVDITARVGKPDWRRYPMAGMTSHKVKVGVYNPTTKQTVYLKTSDPTNRYFSNVSWSKDSKQIFIQELNRDQNHMQLFAYDATTGSNLGMYYEEKHPKYVEPDHTFDFIPWEEGKYLLHSKRDGFNHLYVVNLHKKKDASWQTSKSGGSYREYVDIKQLTTGNWLVKEVLGVNAKRKEVIFSSTKASALQTNLYKVNLNTGVITALDNEQGVHYGKTSTSGNYVLDTYSTPEQPRNIEIASVTGTKHITLHQAENPFKEYQMPKIETGTIKAADGVTDLHYRLMRPEKLDPNKKYPAIIYVYGGPHAQLVTNSWLYDASGWDIYMANKGYIMLTVDNRGSDCRGVAFEQVTFRNLGIEETRDQMEGVKLLQSLPYVDSSRIGVHGWSFGGHMTTGMLLRQPETFKVGVAGGPVIDWSYYEIMYGERYMDTPESNPEGYSKTNLKNYAQNLKGRLLIIHDDHDDTCVPQHTLSFMKACVDARTYPDLFIYPGHKHNVLGPDRVHLHYVITRYFEDHL